jgi:hypothetical protein
VGGVRGLRITSDKSVQAKRFAHIRHAVSLHECRNKYEPRLYQFSPEDSLGGVRSCKQVWFAGCHSDIGGSYEESELSDIALRWMIDEVTTVQPALRMKPASQVGNYLGLAHDEAYAVPLWTLTGLQRREQPIDADIHPEALLRDQAMNRRPPPETVWRPLLTRGWFWTSLLAVCVLNLAAILQVLQRVGVAVSWSSITEVWRHQAWPATYCAATDSLRMAAITGTVSDFFLIAAYPFLLATLLVHAYRRMNAHGGLLAAPLDRMISQWPPLALILADIGENSATLHWLLDDCAMNSWMRYLLPLCSAVKLVAVGFIGVYLLLALTRSGRLK